MELWITPLFLFTHTFLILSTYGRSHSLRGKKADGPCLCHFSIRPVCGVNGVTYPNWCFSECKNVEVKHGGVCKPAKSQSENTVEARWNGKVKYGGHVDVNKIDRYGEIKKRWDNTNPIGTLRHEARRKTEIPPNAKRWSVKHGGKSKVQHADRFGTKKRGDNELLREIEEDVDEEENIDKGRKRWESKYGGNSDADQFGNKKRVDNEELLREIEQDVDEEENIDEGRKRWELKYGGHSDVSNINRNGKWKRHFSWADSLSTGKNWHSMDKRLTCECDLHWDPVCTEIGVTYANACWAECRGFKYIAGKCK